MDSHKNLAYSTIATAPTPATSGTSVTVAAGHGSRFPTVPFNATVWAAGEIPVPSNAEIVRVTAIVSDTLTIVRAQEGTLARIIVVGDQIAATITAKTLTDIEDATSTETSARVAQDDVLSQAVSVVSQAVSVETAGRVAADTSLSNAISATSAALSTTASALSTRIDTVSQAVSVETAARIAGDNALSNAVSVVAAAVVVVSALISTTASAMSVRIDTVSQQVSVLSQAHSALSQAHSVLSADHVSLKDRVSALSSDLTSAKDRLSVVSSDATSVKDRVSGISADLTSAKDRVSVLSADHTSAKDRLSALSDAHTSLVNRVSANSGTGGSGSVTSNEVSVAIAVETSNRVSADNALSNAVSALSATLSTAISAISQVHSVLSADHVSLKDRVSANSADVTSLKDRVSAISDAHTSLVNRVSANSGTGGTGSVTSNEVSVAIAVETSNRISADNALSNAVSALSATLSTAISAISQAHSALSAQVASVQSALSALSADELSLKNRVSGISDQLTSVQSAVSALSQALSVLSADELSLKDRVSANSALVSTVASALSARIDTVSNAVSVLSATLSTVASALSARVDTVSNAVSVLSATLSTTASALSQAISILSTNYTSLVNRVSANSGTGGTGSVTSTELSAAVDGIVLALQNQDSVTVSAGAPVFIFTSANTFKRADASATSSKHVAGLVVTGSVAVSAIGNVRTQGRVTLTTAQWDAITGGSGGLTAGTTYYLDSTIGKLTTTAPAVTIRRPVGIALSTTEMFLIQQAAGWDALSDAVSVGTATANALSNAISALSAQVASVQSAVSYLTSAVSNLSQLQSALSQAVSVISQQVSVLSAGLGGMQMKVLQGAATISTSGAMSNISGLSLSVAAGATYQLEGRVLFICSALTTVGFGLSYPAMAAMGVAWRGFTSANPGVGSITPGAGGRYEVYQMESAANAGSNSAVLSMQPNLSAGFTNMVMIEGLLNVSAAGTVQLAARTSASPGFVVLKGSFIRAYKIA